MKIFMLIVLAGSPIWAQQMAPSRAHKLKRAVRVLVVEPRISPRWEAANLAGGIIGNLIGQWMARPRGPSAFDNWNINGDEPMRVESEFVAPYRAPTVDPIAIFTIESSQPDSEVLIDAKPIGLAPVLITLASGTRYVLVRREGFRDWAEEIKANPGDALTVHAELKPIPEESSVIVVKLQNSSQK